MPPARALHVILCWHMHQPDYRDGHGEYRKVKKKKLKEKKNRENKKQKQK
jgi:hypothetical protein